MQTVRPGGAADRAGIQQQDVIVKVNGTHVTQSTHGEVVELIAGRTTFILGLGRVLFPENSHPRIPEPGIPEIVVVIVNFNRACHHINSWGSRRELIADRTTFILGLGMVCFQRIMKSREFNGFPIAGNSGEKDVIALKVHMGKLCRVL